MRTRRTPVVFLALAGLIASLLAVSPLALAASATGSSPAASAPPATTSAAAAPAAPAHIASGFTTYKYAVAATCPPPLGVGQAASYFSKDDCGYGIFAMSGSDITSASVINVTFFGENGTEIPNSATTASFRTSDGNWDFDIAPKPAWPTGVITVKITVQNDPAPAGQGTFFLNQLGVDFDAIS